MPLPQQGEPAAGLTQALMRVADYFIIDANDERMAGVICRPSLRVPGRFFTFVFRVEAYNRKAAAGRRVSNGVAEVAPRRPGRAPGAGEASCFIYWLAMSVPSCASHAGTQLGSARGSC